MAAFHWAWEFAKACWQYGVGAISIPRWLFAALVVLSASLIALLIVNMRRAAKSPSEYDYNENHFEGVLWRWHYAPGGMITNLWCYCPTCDTVLVYRDDYDDGRGYSGIGNPVMHVTCERCGPKQATLAGHRESAVARVTRQIERNLRVGDWRKVVERKWAMAGDRAKS